MKGVFGAGFLAPRPGLSFGLDSASVPYAVRVSPRLFAGLQFGDVPNVRMTCEKVVEMDRGDVLHRDVLTVEELPRPVMVVDDADNRRAFGRDPVQSEDGRSSADA